MLKYRRRIFDFDDWNDHAVANVRPYLTTESFDSSISASWEPVNIVDLDNLGGRIENNLKLFPRSEPYVIRSDITVMPDATLQIYPDVVMEFEPNVGILVLGTLKAIGAPGHEIVMRSKKDSNEIPKAKKRNAEPEIIKLCKEENCTSNTNEGNLLYILIKKMLKVSMCFSQNIFYVSQDF